MPRTEKAKNISPKVKEALKAVKIINYDKKVSWLLKELKTNKKVYRLNGDRLPSIRYTYSFYDENKDEIDKLRRDKELTPNDLDKPWNIGTRLDVAISPDMIPLLLDYWKLLMDVSAPGGDISSRLTIGHVKMMIRLYPFFNVVWNAKYSNEPSNRKIGKLSRIADIYEQREQVMQVLKKENYTRDLDVKYFVNQDFSDDADLDSLKTNIKYEKETIR